MNGWIDGGSTIMSGTGQYCQEQRWWRWYAHTCVLYSGNTARRSRVTSIIVAALETPRWRWRSLSIPFDGFTMVGSKSEYGLYIVGRCRTCYLYSLLGSGIYYLSVVWSTNLMMRMMMEQPEHSFACAFEAFTIYVRMNITTKNSIWGFVGSSASTIFGSTLALGVYCCITYLCLEDATVFFYYYFIYIYDSLRWTRHQAWHVMTSYVAGRGLLCLIL